MLIVFSTVTTNSMLTGDCAAAPIQERHDSQLAFARIQNGP